MDINFAPDAPLAEKVVDPPEPLDAPGVAPETAPEIIFNVNTMSDEDLIKYIKDTFMELWSKSR